MSANQAQTQPLAERSPNASPKKAQAQTDSLAKPYDQMTTKDKSQTLQQEPELVPELKQMQSYISPSDTIMSPTTKKLEAIRGKRFAYVSIIPPPGHILSLRSLVLTPVLHVQVGKAAVAVR